MNWQGKVIGGSLGSFFGPLGTLAGAAAGHFFVDRKRTQAELRERRKCLGLLAGTLHELAVADEPVSPAEARVIHLILAETNEQMGRCLSPAGLIPLCDAVRSISHAGSLLASQIRSDEDLSRRIFFRLLRVAASDGSFTEPENRYLEGMASLLRIPPDLAAYLSRLFVQRFPDHATEDRLSACRTLGVPGNASEAEIKKAYRAMSMKYHPDRHANLEPEIRALTAEKFAQIKRAYDVLSAQASIGRRMWSRHPVSRRLVEPKPGSVVLCFVCGQRIRLPRAFDPFQSRCPVCQALLAFDYDFARTL